MKLVHKLEPLELEQLFRDQMGVWTAEQKGNLTFFANTLASLADQVHTVQSAALKLKRKNGHGHTRDTQSSRSQEPPGIMQKTGRFLRDRLGNREELDNSKNKGIREEWNKPCLKDDCDGIHPITKYPITPNEKQHELLNKLFSNKKQRDKKTKLASIRSVSHTSLNEDDGRYSILLTDVEEVALEDYGADFSTISQTVFVKSKETRPSTPFEQFEKPMILELALNRENPANGSTASGKIQLSLTIVLASTGLPVGIRDVSFLVADGAMAEVLLGRLFLKAIGFDLGKHLHEIETAIVGMSEKELRAKTARLTSTVFKGLSYQEADDGPIEAPECLQTGFGVHLDESIHQAMRKAVEKARSN
eukprot:gb/GEZJ01005328.1/.p1 GENE.gb/GEZJ01005328.1/~~gb/GEZJ01005328.1/.p1  ORF type:complete len:362 (-),score=51.23 gb/GEZJ01005328.1/:2083-3168(-)